MIREINDQNRDPLSPTSALCVDEIEERYGATIFVTRPTLVSPAYRLSRLSIAQ